MDRRRWRAGNEWDVRASAGDCPGGLGAFSDAVEPLGAGCAWVHCCFDFNVPQKFSHYEVTYCCVPGLREHVDAIGKFQERSGYYGEIAVDPVTGVVLRLMLQADLLVEYEPVEIGGKTYYCPAKSIAVSRARAKLEMKGWNQTAVRNLFVTMLTDTVFSDYHRFRGDMRIVTDEDTQSASAPQ